jgi:quinolinate synthase
MDLITKIKELKKTKNAIILAHNYQIPAIFEVADSIGDSYELAKKAQETAAAIIVFAGVRFMAETAKILNPDKKVLLPDLNAGCPMADMVDREKLQDLKDQHPEAKVVCYVNTTADTKTLCDVCVTSANAVKIVRALKTPEIIFAPDQHLAEYVQIEAPEIKIIPFTGYCPIHAAASETVFEQAVANHPEAKVLIHPETPQRFHQYADAILGTGGMIKYVANSNSNTFLVATEKGMSARLKREFPTKKFIPILDICPDMKQISLENIHQALTEERYEITLPSEVMTKAKKPLEKMMELGE